MIIIIIIILHIVFTVYDFLWKPNIYLFVLTVIFLL